MLIERPACTSCPSGVQGVRDQRKQVARLIRNGYRVVYRKDGYVVLHRTRVN